MRLEVDWEFLTNVNVYFARLVEPSNATRRLKLRDRVANPTEVVHRQLEEFWGLLKNRKILIEFP